VISPLLKRASLLVLAAVALGACNFGLVIDPDPADPGDTVTVSNAEGPHCVVEEEEDGMPVDVIMITDITSLLESGELDVVASVTTDADGLFETTIDAPERPGQHLLLAICGGLPEELEPEQLRAMAVEDPVDEDGVIVDSLRVTQPALSVSVDDDEVAPGDTVTATFNRCQDENDFGFFDELPAPGAVDTDDPALDFPDLDVFVDGELVETIAGEERYPTGTVDVAVQLDDEGDHEIAGVCQYQTFALDVELLVDELNDEQPELPRLEQGTLGAAAIDYPLVEGPFTLDSATLSAVVVVTVAEPAVDGTGAAPVPAPVAPTYAG
jgi:hypothetical protein